MKLTTASKITILRVLLIPVVIVLMYLDFEWHMYCALAVFVIASASDFVDGYIARHCNQVSNFGKFLDPLADKLMTFTVIICITADGIIPLWAVVVFFLKELTMAIGGYLMYQKLGDVISSNWLGKTSTGVFFVVCAALVLFPAIPRPWATGLISFALALTLAALCSYIFQYRKALKKRKQA